MSQKLKVRQMKEHEIPFIADLWNKLSYNQLSRDVFYEKDLEALLKANNKDGIEISTIDERGENSVYTGDLVEIINNTLTIKGRKNDVIIRPNGENIIPSEIEANFDFLRKFPVEYTVIGINESPVLVISLKKDNIYGECKTKLIDEISKRNQELALYKRVVSVYFIEVALPLTSTSKVKNLCS